MQRTAAPSASQWVRSIGRTTRVLNWVGISAKAPAAAYKRNGGRGTHSLDVAPTASLAQCTDKPYDSVTATSRLCWSQAIKLLTGILIAWRWLLLRTARANPHRVADTRRGPPARASGRPMRTKGKARSASGYLGASRSNCRDWAVVQRRDDSALDPRRPGAPFGVATFADCRSNISDVIDVHCGWNADVITLQLPRT